MSIGSQLRAAREKKSLTRSQVAAATRMKVQTVEALEADDYKQIPAPIYAKGFLKSYAELVGLDVKALLDEYMRRTSSPKPEPAPAVAPKTVPAPAAAVPAAIPRPEAIPSPASPAVSSPVAAPSSLSRPTPRFGNPPASAPAPAPAPAPAAAPAPVPAPEAGRVPEKCVFPPSRDPELDIDAPQRPAGGGMTFGRLVWLSIGLGVLLVFLISSLSRCAGPAPSTSHRAAVAE
jgi:cytoskeleton protein RodZ